MNRYLIDTNILVFLISGDFDEINKDVSVLINDYNSKVDVSTVSLIELVQLYRINKIKFRKGQNMESVLLLITDKLNIAIVDFGEKHIKTLSNLDVIDGHNDPFDHAIISHAITDRYTLISSDGKFKHYQSQKLNFIYNKR